MRPATFRRPLFLRRIHFQDFYRGDYYPKGYRSAASPARCGKFVFIGTRCQLAAWRIVQSQRPTRRPGLLRNSVRVDSEVLCLNDSFESQTSPSLFYSFLFQSVSSESKFTLWKAKADHGTVRTKAANHFLVSV
jgi:hypothetical protein